MILILLASLKLLICVWKEELDPFPRRISRTGSKRVTSTKNWSRTDSPSFIEFWNGHGVVSHRFTLHSDDAHSLKITTTAIASLIHSVTTRAPDTSDIRMRRLLRASPQGSDGLHPWRRPRALPRWRPPLCRSPRDGPFADGNRALPRRRPRAATTSLPPPRARAYAWGTLHSCALPQRSRPRAPRTWPRLCYALLGEAKQGLFCPVITQENIIIY
jgi:hypothetical protein